MIGCLNLVEHHVGGVIGFVKAGLREHRVVGVGRRTGVILAVAGGPRVVELSMRFSSPDGILHAGASDRELPVDQ